MSALATEVEVRLSDAQRDTLVAQIERDGYAILPDKLPPELMAENLEAIDRIAARMRKERQALHQDASKPVQRSVKLQHCVEHDPAFRKLMLYTPALQLCYDFF